VELRFGLLKTPKNYIADSEIAAFKPERLIEFLKRTQVFNVYLAYMAGMSDFAKNHSDFKFNALAIIDKSISPVFFNFLAEQLMDFVKGVGGYHDDRVVDLFKAIVDFQSQTFAKFSDQDWQQMIGLMKKSLVGVDTAGSEYRKNQAGQVVWKYDASVHARVFDKLHASGLFRVFTSHAGESFASLEDGLDGIESTADYLKVIRLGHGLALGINPKTLIGQKDEYGKIYDRGRVAALIARQDSLIEKIKAKGIAIEVNFSCNIHTGNIRNPFKHPTYRMYMKGLKLILGTDGTSMNNTTIAKEMARMFFSLNLPEKSIREMLQNAKAYQFDI
jgi:hypothetical protein